MARIAEIYPHTSVCVHLDYGRQPAFKAIQVGRMRVMGDGSLRADAKAPADWDGAVASIARLGGVSVGVYSRASDRANELHPSVVTAYG